MAATAPGVVVVGASLAGTRTAEELRTAGYEGRITLVGNESGLPYDRPPLSKQVLAGRKSAEDVTLRSRDQFDALGVELRLGATAVALRGKDLVLDDGDVLPFSELVVATGVSARRLPIQPTESNVHVLRTLADSLLLREDLRRSRSLVVVGAGFIGAEVAAVARGMGVDVTMVEALSAPFARALGAEVGARCAQLHHDAGVRLMTDAVMTSFSSDGSAVRLVLADGRVVEADTALVGVGTTVNTGWLAGSGLDVTNGVACDAAGRAVGRPDVHAVGDCAAWEGSVAGARHRVEHWTNASEQAHVAAMSLLGRPPLRSGHEMPYFWSDQYKTKIQLVGRPDLADRVEVGPAGGKPGSLLGLYFASSHLVAAVTFGAPVLLARVRPLVATRAAEGDVRAATAELVG